MIKKYNTIEEFLKDYEASPHLFNMLVPVQSIQEIGQIYKPVINLVFINTDLEEGQIYIQKNAQDPYGKQYDETRYSITRRGLMILAAAADCHFIDSVQSYNPETEHYTCVANMKMHDPSGGWRIVTESKSVNKVKQLRNGNKMLDPEAPQKAESGAQNRCVRSGLNIKNHYSLNQLQFPFVAVYPALNTADPDVKQAVIAGAVASQNMLFGTPRQMARLAAGQPVDSSSGAQIQPPVQQEPPAKEQEKLKCNGCGAEIQKNVAEYSRKNFQDDLCTKCQQVRKKGGAQK